MKNLKDTVCQTSKPLSAQDKEKLLLDLNDWKIIEDHHLEKTYYFSNYAQALAWVNALSAIAEELNHHPDVYLRWGQVTLQIWTHTSNDLQEGDYILAAKIDQLEQS